MLHLNESKLRKLLESGMQISDICKKMKCSRYVIYQFRQKSGIKKPLRKLLDHAEIIRLYNGGAGMKLTEIAQLTGCKLASIQYHIRQDQAYHQETREPKRNYKALLDRYVAAKAQAMGMSEQEIRRRISEGQLEG